MAKQELLINFITSLEGCCAAEVVVFPVITGSNSYDRIYEGYPDVALDMVASHTFDGKIQLLEYIPRVLAGPSGIQPGR